MNFVCIVFELGDKMLTLSSMENLIVQCNLKKSISCLYLPTFRSQATIVSKKSTVFTFSYRKA